LLSSQLIGVWEHPFEEQVSIVHGFLSSQRALLRVLTHPQWGLQESTVQGFPSLQFFGVKTIPLAASQVAVEHKFGLFTARGV
jgi:hypothetical protein